jgi:hypothetical protein
MKYKISVSFKDGKWRAYIYTWDDIYALSWYPVQDEDYLTLSFNSRKPEKAYTKALKYIEQQERYKNQRELKEKFEINSTFEKEFDYGLG